MARPHLPLVHHQNKVAAGGGVTLGALGVVGLDGGDLAGNLGLEGDLLGYALVVRLLLGDLAGLLDLDGDLLP